jgi:peptidylprolyl isomerase
MRRRALALIAAGALVLAGCSSASPDATATDDGVAQIGDIEIGVSDSLAPSLTLPTDEVFEEAQGRVEWEGEGAPLVDDQPLLLDIYAVSLEDGRELVNSYDGLPRPFVFAPEVLGDDVYELLADQNVGTRVVLVAPALEGEELTPSVNPDATATVNTDTKPDVALVIDVLSDRAVGTPKESQREDLPWVTVNKDTGEPTIEIGDDLPEPTTVEAETLIQGDGEQVQKGSYVLVNYKAVHWDGSDYFSSWPADKAPFATQIGTEQVIPAWDQALMDQLAGSQVLIVAPPEFGYPEEGPLVFVVDILDVWTPVE